MRSYLLAIALPLVGSVGCAPTPGNQYVLAIDPKLSPAYIDAIYSAVFAWTDILDGALTITFEDTCHNQDNEICMWASTGADILSMGGNSSEIGYTLHYSSSNSANVFFPVDVDAKLDETTLIQVAAHEIGHGLGLSHDQPNTLMCYTVQCAGNAGLLPGCAEVSQYYWVRNGDSGFTAHTNKSCPVGETFTLSGQ